LIGNRSCTFREVSSNLTERSPKCGADMIRFSCPTCNKKIKAAFEAAGKIGRCKCGERVRIPTPQGLPMPALEGISYPCPSCQHIIQAGNGDTVTTCRCGAIVCIPSRTAIAESLEQRRRNILQTPTPEIAAVPSAATVANRKPPNTLAAVVCCIVCLPIFSCCMFGTDRTSQNPDPPKWDIDKLKQDIRDNPDQPIFVPNDGSQPRVVK